MGTTTIQIDNKLKKRLEKLKIQPRETYSQLISRLLSRYPKNNPENASRESLIETVEVLSDPTLMRGIKEGLEEEGGVSLEDFEKEFDSK